jgi:hypothetical protein
MRGHSPNFHIHVPVSDLYIPTIDQPIFLQKIRRPILGIYKSLTVTDTWMWKLGLRPRYSQKRNTYMTSSLQCVGQIIIPVLCFSKSVLVLYADLSKLCSRYVMGAGEGWGKDGGGEGGWGRDGGEGWGRDDPRESKFPIPQGNTIILRFWPGFDSLQDFTSINIAEYFFPKQDRSTFKCVILLFPYNV